MPDGVLNPTRFVILAVPRSGSNMLCTLLNSHPEILCHHEIFNPAGIYYALPLRETPFCLGTREERERVPLTFLERIWQTPLGHGAVGFKMTHRQNEAVFQSVLHDPGVKKVVLKRHNRIKTFVSRRIAELTGTWELYREADRPRSAPRVRVDVQELKESIAFNEAYYAEIDATLQATRQSYASVLYERLCTQEERRRLLAFLCIGTDPASLAGLKVESVQQNPCDLRDLVSNYAELEQALQGTDLELELGPRA